MFLPRYLIALLSQRSHPSARRNSVKSYNVNTIALQESFHLKKRKKEKRNTQNSLLHNSGGKIERKKDTHITGSHYVVTALLLMLYHLSYHYTSNYKKKIIILGFDLELTLNFQRPIFFIFLPSLVIGEILNQNLPP